MSTDHVPRHLPPTTPVGDLPFVRKPQAAALRKLGVASLGDILWHAPRRHEDRRGFTRFPEGPVEHPACLLCEVEKRTFQRWGRGTVVEATVRDASDGADPGRRLVCRWFHAWHVARSVVAGARLVVFGVVRQKGRRLVVEHPEFEVVESESPDALLHMGRLVPVHPAAAGAPARVLRRIVRDALEAIDWSGVAEPLPPSLRELSAADMFRSLHFPGDFSALARARRQAALAECHAVQVELAARRARVEAMPKRSRVIDGRLPARFLDSLPFALTGAQQRVLDEIRADIASTRPMNRLLQGDVGSGKTVVAAAAMVAAASAGCECAFMAPTRLLARQHHRTLTGWLEPLGIPVLLHTGESAAGREAAAVASRRPPPVVVGTHALIHGGFPFQRLGLVVIDEQHKFGVAQREKLRELGDSPDTLVMTATPIPRTLSLTLYGDLSVSVIDELPPGRGELVTRVRTPGALPRIAAFLRAELSAGRQAFIVHPLIDESESAADARAAAAEYEEWSRLLSPWRVALVHGRVPPDERDALMAQFAAGAVSALVATTVIEVGIDVPNATVMLVRNAERFGLAQLHQLRGRVGRGGAARSYCILLLGDHAGDGEAERLRLLEGTRDGFRVAEEDFRRRGPGNVIGLEQSGLPPLRVADLHADLDLMLAARAAVSQPAGGR